MVAPDESVTVPANAPVPAVCADIDGAERRIAIHITLPTITFSFIDHSSRAALLL
jgi:hypothetical protein